MNYRDNILSVPHATPQEGDAAQYMFRHGKKQANLCGHFCVAYCVGALDITAFLDAIQVSNPKWYAGAFPNGISRTTSIYDLNLLLKEYGYQPTEKLTNIPLKPDTVSTKLLTHRAIVGVKIDVWGYLVGSGIPHWIILEDIEVYDNQYATCNVYNPYTNKTRPFSWRELMTSTGAYKQGLWVSRESSVPNVSCP
jgi:hypothetical protein